MNPVLVTGAAVLTLAVLLALDPRAARAPGSTASSPTSRTGASSVPVYRVVGVDPRTEQRWTGYALSVVAFSVVSVVAPLPAHRGAGPAALVAGPVDGLAHRREHRRLVHDQHQLAVVLPVRPALGYTVQAVGLTVQNFLSAAVGLAVAVALIRGLARQQHRPARQLLGRPGARHRPRPAAARSRRGGRAARRRRHPEPHRPDDGHDGHRRHTRSIQGGPVASQEAIKELGTNGGGFFNANSAHPFENPNACTNLFEIFLLLVIPFSLPCAYGRMVGNRRQGCASPATWRALLVGSASACATWAESPPRRRPASGRDGGQGAALRHRPVGDLRRRHHRHLHRRGQLDARQLQRARRGGAAVDMMLGEVSPGGVGTGLYSLLIYVVLAVFIAGLMVGRTPELPGKEDRPQGDHLVALNVVVTPALVLIGTGLGDRAARRHGRLLNSGPHGLTEMMYAFTSAANNNGSAFAGLTADQPFLNLALAFCMFFGRLVPIVLVLALAGSLAAAAQAPGHRRHHAHRHPPVHRPARRHRRGRRRAHLLPGPGTRADRGGPIS